MPSLLRTALVAVVLLSVQAIAQSDAPKPAVNPPAVNAPAVNPAAVNPDLAAADQLYRSGKFANAESGYRALLKADATLVPAQVGMVRSMLRQQKIDEAFEEVNAALSAQPNTAALLAAKGDIQFRRGEMVDAETSYLAAKRHDPREVHAYLGLARLYRAYSIYRHAYEQLNGAHDIAPGELEVQRAWLGMLPRKERLAALQAYLAGPHPEDEDETKWMTEYLDFLSATANKPSHSCKLVHKDGAHRNQARDQVRVGWPSHAGHRPVGTAQ